MWTSKDIKSIKKWIWSGRPVGWTNHSSILIQTSNLFTEAQFKASKTFQPAPCIETHITKLNPSHHNFYLSMPQPKAVKISELNNT